jgi:hypothetical protein
VILVGLDPRKGLVAFLAATASAPAQVPDGWYVASCFGGPLGSGGLFFVHPRNPGAPVPVTGLGPDLLGPAGGFPYEGAKGVLLRPSDGALIVGEIAPPGSSIDLHVLTLSGSAAAADVQISVGISGAGSFPGQIGRIAQCALLPNGDVLVGVDSIASGPLAGQILGTIDLAAGTVSPVPVVPVPAGFLNALAIDAAGTTAYLGMLTSVTLSTIQTVPVPGGGSPALLVALADTVTNLSVESAGSLVAAGGTIAGLYRVTLAGTVTPMPGAAIFPNAVAVEAVTGGFALGSSLSGPTAYWLSALGPTTTLASLGTGYMSGIAVSPNPEAFGTGSPGNNLYSWALAPNPGGLPTAGNGSFSLTVGSSPGTAPGIWAASLLPGTGIPILGVAVWIDPSTLLTVQPLPPSGTIPLPIPPLPSLAGQRVFFQTFHLDPGAPSGFASSGGVEATVI